MATARSTTAPDVLPEIKPEKYRSPQTKARYPTMIPPMIFGFLNGQSWQPPMAHAHAHAGLSGSQAGVCGVDLNGDVMNQGKNCVCEVLAASSFSELFVTVLFLRKS